MVVRYTTIPMQSVPVTNNVAFSYLANGLWRGVLDTTGARGTDLPPPFFLTFCFQIYFQYNFFISLLFHLLFLILTCSCQYSYNLMLTSNCMLWITSIKHMMFYYLNRLLCWIRHGENQNTILKHRPLVSPPAK